MVKMVPISPAAQAAAIQREKIAMQTESMRRQRERAENSQSRTSVHEEIRRRLSGLSDSQAEAGVGVIKIPTVGPTAEDLAQRVLDQRERTLAEIEKRRREAEGLPREPAPPPPPQDTAYVCEVCGFGPCKNKAGLVAHLRCTHGIRGAVKDEVLSRLEKVAKDVMLERAVHELSEHVGDTGDLSDPQDDADAVSDV